MLARPLVFDPSGLHRLNDYAALVPARIELRMVEEGTPLAGHLIDVFFDDSDVPDYRDVYPAEPHLTLLADEQGRVVLPTERWQDTTWVKRLDANTIILRARTPDNTRWGYAFLPVYDLNVAYLHGNTERASLTVEVDVR